jgi:hypothetical protein
MQSRTAAFTADGTKDLGLMIDPVISVQGGTWGSGTLKIYFDGVLVDAGNTADFAGTIYDSCGRLTKVTAILTGSTDPELTVTALYDVAVHR